MITSEHSCLNDWTLMSLVRFGLNDDYFRTYKPAKFHGRIASMPLFYNAAAS